MKTKTISNENHTEGTRILQVAQTVFSFVTNMGWNNKVSSSNTPRNFLDDVRSLYGCFLSSVPTSLRF